MSAIVEIVFVSEEAAETYMRLVQHPPLGATELRIKRFSEPVRLEAHCRDHHLFVAVEEDGEIRHWSHGFAHSQCNSAEFYLETMRKLTREQLTDWI